MSGTLGDALFAGLVMPALAESDAPRRARRRPLPPLPAQPARIVDNADHGAASTPVFALAAPSAPAAAALAVTPVTAPTAPTPVADLAADALAPATARGPLLTRSDVWRGRAAIRRGGHGEPTGHAALDALLPDGGWPRGALSEILHARDGVGEIALVMPALAALTRRGERALVIAPPYVPCAAGLAQRGVVLERLVLVRASSRHEVLWTAEQALRSGAIGAVLLWPAKASLTELRRLALAAEAGGALAFLWRDVRAAAEASPAALRVVAQREYAREQVRVLRCRGLLTAPGHAVDLVA